MSKINIESILNEVTNFYLTSNDFNGIPACTLAANMEVQWKDLIKGLSQLITEEKVCVLYSDWDENTHIRRVRQEAIDVQISKLGTKDLYHTCIYPLAKHLEKVIDRSQYKDKPYTLDLAMGSPQLDFRAFDLSILEHYRNDPRYYYANDDIRGRISVHDEYFESDKMAQSEQTHLQTFGFCYNEKLDRAVAVFLRYLSDLSSEHQQIWKSKELSGEYKLHPDYYRNSILGEWGTGISIFEAFTRELEIINSMCSLIGKPNLFRESFVKSRPREFGFLLRPTLSEFNSFVHLLDKMMSDNINKDFFKEVVNLEKEEEREDGKIVIKPKGTIQLLQDWMNKYFQPEDPKPVEEMFAVFKKVRKLRQKPAHAFNGNKFDQEYFRKQRTLVKEVYNAIRTLRLILANHPAVKANPPKIGKLLFEGKIWDI